MSSALLLLTLLSADDAALAPPTAEVVVPAPEPAADDWPGEGARRVHWGIGARVHGGLLDAIGGVALVAESEVIGFVSIRVLGHHEWRMGWGVAAGWPDSVVAESNTSFRFHLTPRVSVGLGVAALWGFWSLRGGVDVPISVRLGPNRRHEISLSLRATAGVFNRTTYVWYDFAHQHFAWSGGAVLGYAAIF